MPLPSPAHEPRVRPAQVHVVCRGGTYSFGDFCRDCPNGHDSPGGANILIVFNTDDPVYITGTGDNRQFFGSILAPFAEVVVDGSVGFVDGFIVAKSYREMGPNAGAVQIHGNCWAAPHGIMGCGAYQNCRQDELTTSSTANDCSSKTDSWPEYGQRGSARKSSERTSAGRGR